MKYNVLKFITNTQNQYTATVAATYDNLKGARVNYHQALAALVNADDVKTAVVKIVDEFGNDVDRYREVIENETESAEE